MDGNGRMGRLWQTLILGQWNQLFYFLPIESLVKDQQERYYQVLAEADAAASSTVFVEMLLEVIDAALVHHGSAFGTTIDQVTDQVRKLLGLMDDRYWTVQELMTQLALSHRPTFHQNYLRPALEAGLIVMKYPDSPRSPKQQYRKC
jgi:hypothetical protein